MQKKNKRLLLDASALLAVLKKETGYQKLEKDLSDSEAVISAVNFSEVIAVLKKLGMPHKEAENVILSVVPTVISFTQDSASLAGDMISVTKEYGLSLGDRACIATGIIHNLPIYTTDKAWQLLSIAEANITLIR